MLESGGTNFDIIINKSIKKGKIKVSKEIIEQLIEDHFHGTVSNFKWDKLNNVSIEYCIYTKKEIEDRKLRGMMNDTFGSD